HTNEESLLRVKNKSYALVIRGRSSIQHQEVNFKKEITVPLELDLNDLETGTNIISLFDENNKPVAERLFFNYIGLPVDENLDADMTNTPIKSRDTLEVRLSFKDSKKRNISITVLP